MVGNFGWTVKVNLVSHRVRHLSDEDHLLGYHVHVLLQGQARRGQWDPRELSECYLVLKLRRVGASHSFLSR